MPRRHRIRRVLKWTGTNFCGAILVACGACLCWGYVNVGNTAVRVGISKGSVYAMWDNSLRPSFRDQWLIAEPEIHPEWSASLWMQSLRPRLDLDEPARCCAELPLWIPFLLLAIPTAWLWRLDRRRPRAGCCRKCDYDLTGNVSGRCPECGAVVETVSRERGAAPG